MFPLPDSAQRAGQSSRNKIPVAPGRSLMHWIKLSKSGKDLRGTGPRLLRITSDELAKHASIDDAWMSIRGWVYNVTAYMEYHPGGALELMKGIGKDATDLFDAVHRWVNYESMLQACLIGKLVDVEPPKKSSSLLAPVQQSTNLKVPNKPKKAAENAGLTSIKVPVMMPPPNKLSTANPKAPSQETEHETDVEIKVPVVMPPPPVPVPKVSWKDEGKLVMITYKASFIIDSFTCDLKHDENKASLEVEIFAPGTRSKREGFHITFEHETAPEIALLKYGNNDQLLQIAIEKADISKEWKTLGKVVEKPTGSMTKRRCKIDLLEKLTHDTNLYKLCLDVGSHVCVPVGGHIHLEMELGADDGGVTVSRPYTVVTPDLSHDNATDTKTLYLIIKSYADGVFTSRLLRDYSKLSLNMTFLGEGRFDMSPLNDSVGKKSKVLMVCAGTGITPMIKVLCHCLQFFTTTSVKMLFFNKTPEDAIWRDKFAAVDSSRLLVEHVTDGRRVDLTMIEKELRENDDDVMMTFVCGPTPFTRLVDKFLKQLHVPSSRYHLFT